MKTASVSSLMNSLSAKLKGVMAGEPLLVTDHRKPVAVLQPLTGDLASERMAGLVARGLVNPSARALDVEALLALPKAKGTDLTPVLLEERDAR